ncbi:hypothetical protein [Ferrimonas balearica]|uniref:hypothetical protein n=1 Tax=Ferrimonas balearica TaxID=44012 RepID=UPI001C990B3A|nr:hypothetical protein [Ferrimonas balearica]MBY5990968.1 hypothetical protein [Ferrimonas balearica]
MKRQGWILAAALALAGCGSDSSSRDELAGITFESPALQQCFDDIRNQFELTTLTDFIMLHCDGYPISNLAGIEALPYLQSVLFEGDALTSLALHDNPEIWQVLLTTPQLASLDLSGLPKLENLWVRAGPELTTLDLTHNPLLSRVHLSQTGLSAVALDAHHELTELNVSENPNLSTLALGDSPALYGLWGYENALTELNLTGLPALEVLSVPWNALSGLDVAANTQLEVLLASFNHIETINLDQNAQLRTLLLLENPLSDETRAYLDGLDWVAERYY